jgi:signal transduction histidine kinase
MDTQPTEIPALRNAGSLGPLLSPDGPPASVLVVDDSPSKLASLEAVVTSMGLNVVMASSGRDALRQLLQRDFAVVLLDVNMPGMDGFETATLIHNRPRSAHMPIIFVTAEAGSEAERYKLYTLGAVDYVYSPIEPDILRAKIQVFVDHFYLIRQLKRQADELQRLAHELQAANDNLEQRVQERTRELKEAQAELVSTARQAGMAEIAINVLHNVGNVLNSVNVSANLVSSRVRASKAKGLSKAVQLLNEHAADLGDFLTRDEKGKLLPDYLNKVAAALAAEQQDIIEELEQLTKNVDHIKDIVTAQQSHAGASSVVETVQMQDLIEDALRMNTVSLSRHHIKVVKELADVPALRLDKARLLQILVNLIRNAKQAMSGVVDRPHQMTLRVNVTDQRKLRICVQDQGEGIAAENLTRIFSHGFTTRKDGHGFGLHSCVLAAKEMGGSLTAHSDGPGKGATFALELPIQVEEETL